MSSTRERVPNVALVAARRRRSAPNPVPTTGTRIGPLCRWHLPRAREILTYARTGQNPIGRHRPAKGGRRGPRPCPATTWAGLR